MLYTTNASGVYSTRAMQQWSKLGDVTVTPDLDNESIMVSGTEKTRSVKFKAVNGAIQITSLDLYYQSGEVQNIAARTTIDSGKESSPIALKNGQILKKIVFNYKLFSGKENGNILIELYGIK